MVSIDVNIMSKKADLKVHFVVYTSITAKRNLISFIYRIIK